MTIKRDCLLTQPALIPMFGGMEKKERLIDRDVVTIGRARGCDFVLDANEVSALHCVLFHAPEGYRVRDSGSRTGTRINGSAVKNSLISNGDILQLGPFSFEVRLPAAEKPSDEAQQLENAQQARRRALELALRLRKRLRSPRSAGKPHSPSNPGLAEKAEDLKAKIKHYEDRICQLEESEQELMEDREQLEQERKTFRQQCEDIERDLTLRKERFEREMQVRTQEKKKQPVETAEPAHSFSPDELALMENRRKELETLRVELQEQEKLWMEKDAQLQEEYEDFNRERQALVKLKTQWDEDQAQARAHMEQQRQFTIEAGEALQDQKQHLSKMIVELKKLQEDMRRSPRTSSHANISLDDQIKMKNAQVELEKSIKENAQLKELLTEAHRVEEDNQKLREEIARLEEQLTSPASKSGPDVAELEREIRELHEALEGARTIVGLPAPAIDKTELEDMNRQLEESLEKLAKADAENDHLREALAEFEKRLEASAQVGDKDAEELKAENEILRRVLTEYEEKFAAQKKAKGNDAQASDEDLRSENELLRRLLQEKDLILNEISHPQTVSASEANAEMEAKIHEYEKILSENQVLQKLVKQKDDLIHSMRNGTASMSQRSGALETYEVELNSFKQELSIEREKLNREIDMLRARNLELDEATRELEMEMSRERAEMARERMRLDRMREDIKAEMERMSRDTGVRESLQGVKKLRDEMNSKRAGTTTNIPAPGSGPTKTVTDKLFRRT